MPDAAGFSEDGNVTGRWIANPKHNGLTLGVVQGAHPEGGRRFFNCEFTQQTRIKNRSEGSQGKEGGV